MEVTKREVLASVGIAAIMVIVGLFLSQKIWQAKLDGDDIYQKAAQITEQELFQYGMRTDLGNAFVYGELAAVDTVSYPEIGGEYMAVEKVEERYTKHAKKVRHTRKKPNGQTETYYTTENTWTWDQVSSEGMKCKEISFCGAVFPSAKIQIPGMEYIDTIRESSKTRYKYYGAAAKYAGTVFTELKDGTIPEGSPFYPEKDIEAAKKDLESQDGRPVFWIAWAGLTALLVYGFCKMENRWMN